MHYLMARMYDPVTARFMQEDTYRGDANDPLSLNLYTYCSNEPLMYSDPSGHSAIGDAWNNYWDNWKTGADMIVNHPEETAQMMNNAVFKPFVTDTLGVKEGTKAYNVIKGVGIRAEGLGITGVNLTKGVAQTANTVAINPIKTDFAALELAVYHKLGGVDDQTYNGAMQSIVDEMNKNKAAIEAIPGNFINGMGHDFGTTFNWQNTVNYFTNPNMSLHDVTDYTQSTVNVGLTFAGGAKLLKAGSGLADAGVAGLRDTATNLADRTGMQPAFAGGYGNVNGWSNVRSILREAGSNATQGLGISMTEVAGNSGTANAFDKVTVYHGSYGNYNEILDNGFSKARTPVYTSTDRAAASDAIYNRYDYQFGLDEMKTNSGIIKSEIPKDEWDSLISKGQIVERKYSGFSGNLNTVEYQFKDGAIDTLNKYRAK